MTKARQTPTPPAELVVEPVPDAESIKDAYDAAVAARTAAAATKQAALRAFAADRSLTNIKALKAADAALSAAESDARVLGEVLADAEANQAETNRLARLAATADLRQRAAESARALIVPAKRVDQCLDDLRQAMDDLRRAAGGVHEDVAAAIDGLALSEDHTIDLRVLLLPRAAARGPATTAAFAGIVRTVVAATDADLSEHVSINMFGRSGSTVARAVLADSQLIASRLGVTLAPLQAVKVEGAPE